MSSSEDYYWGDDPYWKEALRRYAEARESGERTITLDVDVLDEIIFDGDSLAFRLIPAMESVKKHEAWDGHRGAPRLILALLQHLREQAGTHDA